MENMVTFYIDSPSTEFIEDRVTVSLFHRLSSEYVTINEHRMFFVLKSEQTLTTVL